MLSVTIQPYSYRKMSSLKDLKSLAVLKFSHKGIIDDDFCFETVYIFPTVKPIDKNNTLATSFCAILLDAFLLPYSISLYISS